MGRVWASYAGSAAPQFDHCGEIVGIGLLIHQVRNRKGIFKDENVVVEEFVII